MTTITTPKGKKLSDRQYLALKSAQAFNSHANHDHPCEHGHFGCAAWDGGPCFDEVLSRDEAARGDR